MAVIELRTGWTEVPDHMAALMAGLETKTMTWEQAVAAVNRKLEDDQVRKAMKAALGDSMRLGGMR